MEKHGAKAMNKTLLILPMLILASCIAASGQKYKTVELKPITKQGWKYYYDLKKVSSPLALEVPLLAVNDAEVNRYLKASRNWRSAEQFITLVPLIYLLTLPRSQYVDQETFWWIFGGTIAAQLGMEAMSHLKLGLAIDKYNLIILQPTGSLNGAGMKLTYRFR
jgi:hypothetical protein